MKVENQLIKILSNVEIYRQAEVDKYLSDEKYLYQDLIIKVLDFFQLEKISDHLKDLIENFKKCILEYLRNDIYGSLKTFNEDILIKNELLKFLTLQTETIVGKTSLYRIRISEKKYASDNKELFHIPLSLRNITSKQRFNGEGFPSFYLGDSILTSWEETNRPDQNNFLVARFETKCNLNFLLLDSYCYQMEMLKNSTDTKLEILASLFPLVFTTLIPVKDKNSIFKPEYIIPQILQSAIFNNIELRKSINGIKFLSTKTSKYVTSDFETYHYNYVLHLLDYEKSLNGLSDYFKATDSIPFAFSNYLDFNINESIQLKNYNKKIKISKNTPHLNYNQTLFYKTEKYLNSIETNPIE